MKSIARLMFIVLVIGGITISYAEENIKINAVSTTLDEEVVLPPVIGDTEGVEMTDSLEESSSEVSNVDPRIEQLEKSYIKERKMLEEYNATQAALQKKIDEGEEVSSEEMQENRTYVEGFNTKLEVLRSDTKKITGEIEKERQVLIEAEKQKRALEEGKKLDSTQKNTLSMGKKFSATSNNADSGSQKTYIYILAILLIFLGGLFIYLGSKKKKK